MKIQPISNNTVFKGLIGNETRFIGVRNLFNEKYECKLYERDYHPFIDETPGEIESNMERLEKKINAQQSENAAYSGFYIGLVKGKRLKISKLDYEFLKEGIATSTVLNKDI